MFGNIAQIATGMVAGIHNPLAHPLFLPLFGWLEFLVPLIPWVADLLFGGGDEPSQTTTSETTNPTYRSPALGMMEPGILSALLGNAQAMGGAGMPGGVSRFGGNADSMFSDILNLLKKEWPNIKGEYGKPQKDACDECQRYSQNGPNANANYYSQCMAKCKSSSA